MKQVGNNYAFIDSQNLNLNIRNQGWILDFLLFRVYLQEKYGISKAFLFLGYIEENKKLYDFFSRAGYVCIFKPTLEYKDGTIKGNCDAELVLHTMLEIGNFDKAVIVSGDGDFYCLVKYLLEQNKFKKMIIPNKDHYSALLKKLSTPDNNIFDFMNLLKDRLQYIKNEKGSQRDKTQ